MRKSWMAVGVIAAAVAALPAVAPKGARAQKHLANLPPAPPNFALDGDPDNGELIYKQYCLKCHGKRGDGTGIMSKDLDPKPANFTDEEHMSQLSDWELFTGIKEGGKPFGLSDQMTAWKGTLDEEEMIDVGTFIRQFTD